MRNGKQRLMAGLMALGVLMGSAMPRAAHAEPAGRVEAEAALPDGWYDVLNAQGQLIGWVLIQNDQVVGYAWLDEPLGGDESTNH
jgi:hypothetical protein